MPGGYVCSGSMKGTLPPKAGRASVAGDKSLRRLFSKEQRAFFASHAPDGITIDDLSVLGPIFVLKLKVQPEAFSRRITVEMWLYPDGTRAAELSTKCLPGEGLATAEEVREVPAEQGRRVDRGPADQDEDGLGVLRGGVVSPEEVRLRPGRTRRLRATRR